MLHLISQVSIANGYGLNGRGIRVPLSCLRCCSYYILFIYGAGVEPSPPLLRSVIGLLYQPWMIDGDDCGAQFVE
jgi:hypothetical protein